MRIYPASLDDLSCALFLKAPFMTDTPRDTLEADATEDEATEEATETGTTADLTESCSFTRSQQNLLLTALESYIAATTKSGHDTKAAQTLYDLILVI